MLPAFSQASDSCDSRTLARAMDGAQGYAPRSNGKYCDGTFRRDDAGRLEIVAFRVGDAVSTKPPFRLSIPRDQRQPPITNPIRIVGVPRNALERYRFDGLLSPGDPDIPVGTESGLAKISPLPAVGWAAWFDAQDEERCYLPVLIDGKTGPKKVLTVRVATQTSQLVYHVMDDAEQVVLQEKTSAGSNLSPGTAVDLSLDSISVRKAHVHVLVVRADGVRDTHSIKILIP